MARQPRNTQAADQAETIGFINIYATKGGQRTLKVAWQAVQEGDKLALIADKLAGTYTRDDGKTIEIDWNPVGEVNPDDLW